MKVINSNNLEYPVYILAITKSLEQQVYKDFGETRASYNIIKLLNAFISQYSTSGLRIYDYALLGSSYARRMIKNPHVSIKGVAEKYLEVRKFRDGKEFRNPKNGRGEAKHYRLKPEIIEEHGLRFKMEFKDISKDLSCPILPNELKKVKGALDKVQFLEDPRSLYLAEVFQKFEHVSKERFWNKIVEKEDYYFGIHKRNDFELKFKKEHIDIYERWEKQLGAVRVYNAICDFQLGNKNVKRLESNNRLNSSILQIPKESFQMARMEGEPLVEMDLKNCQPCLLFNLLFKDKLDDVPELKRLLDLVWTEYSVLKDIVRSDLKYNELIENTFQGKLYETLQKYAANAGQNLTRDEVKKSVMTVIFSGFKHRSPSSKIWEKHYPALYYFIQDLKKAVYKALKDEKISNKDIMVLDANKRPYEASKSFLALCLQKFEAFIFIDNILMDILSRGIPAFSKHDAILVKISDLPVAKQIVRSKLEQILGPNNFELSVDPMCSECIMPKNAA